jgi:DNA-binding MarR family transcriptional regulator
MKSLVQQHGLKNCACFNVRKSARVLTQHYDAALQPVALRATQFSILAVLSACSGITVTELAHHLMMDRTTLTRNLRPLEKQGLVNTSPGEDKRTRLIELSKKGKNKLEKAIPLWKQAQKQVTRYMGSNRFNEFLTELNYIDKLPAT